MTQVHPGVILSEDFLTPMNISHAAMAEALKLPESEIDEIVQGSRRIDADTAFRLSRFFDNSAQFWFGMQMQYDLEQAWILNGEKIIKEVSVYKRKP